ncbi:MAG: hypothetical protein ACPL6C_03705, partial [bacterium]
LFFDTMINRNDYAPIATQFGYFTESQQFIAPNIPYLWQAYESSPFQSEDSLVGQGILVGGEATPPDILLYGNYWRYHHIYWDWTFYEEPYTDSAVLMRWNPTLIHPGETIKIATYYGIGTVDILLGQLNLSVSSPAQLMVHACRAYSPNPFPINIVATNRMLRMVRNVRATIELPPEFRVDDGDSSRRLSPDSLTTGETGSCSWIVRLVRDYEMDTTLCFSIALSSPDIDSIIRVSSCISVPGIRGVGPVIEYLSPPYRFVSLDTVGILYRVEDTTGVNVSGVVFYVNGEAIRLFESPYIDFSPPNLFSRIPLEFIAPADSIVHTVEAVNENGCVSTYDGPFVIYIDREPPYIVDIAPYSGAVIGGNSFTAVVEIDDRRAGVCWDSVRISINDSILVGTGSPGIHILGDSIIFSSQEYGLNYTSSGSIRICIMNIMDNVRVGPPNRAPSYCWSFYLDTESPHAHVIFPPDNSISSCDTILIMVQLFATSGIDSSSIIFNINGRMYS